jgi:Na+/H+ antiporter NhaD/arsenite permease-like protein
MDFTWQYWFSATMFVAVIVLLITEWIPMMVAALLGALLLVLVNVMSLREAIDYIAQSHGTLALFFGVMVLIRTLQPTQVFEVLAARMLRLTQGRGDRLLLGIVALTTPICAVLPNATTVMLLAPLLPPLAAPLGVDFVPLLILLVFVANSSGLLTLVGDPATFIVGDAINISFVDYLVKLSAGGALAVVTIVITLPFLFRSIWRRRIPVDLDHLPQPQINHPKFLTVGLVIMASVLICFVVGEEFQVPVSPPTVALVGAALALLLAEKSGTDTVNNILRDVDWNTIVFFMCIFVLIGGLEKTGVIQSLSGGLALILGQNIALGAIVLLFVTGLISSLIPNIPLVVALVPLLKDYIVQVKLASPEILAADYSGQIPEVVLPLFYAMMYGATLGGNGTLVGASSNIVAAGVAQQHGRPIAFATFLKYGLPTMGLQLLVSAMYLSARFL